MTSRKAPGRKRKGSKKAEGHRPPRRLTSRPSRRDPLKAAEDAVLSQLPALARAGVKRALAGKPASTLKAVRQMLREIGAERAKAAQTKGHIFEPLRALGRITEFEAAMAANMIQTLRGHGDPVEAPPDQPQDDDPATPANALLLLASDEPLETKQAIAPALRAYLNDRRPQRPRLRDTE